MDYNYLTLIHLFAVIIFFGNIITELLWMRNAIKTKDLKIISFAMNSIIKGDKYFTLPGVFLITVSSALASTFGLWSTILFVISGIAFTLKVAPLQKKIAVLTLSKETSPHFDWTSLSKRYTSWKNWGLVALLTALASLVIMTIKISH
jgi:hypothetical protein